MVFLFYVSKALRFYEMNISHSEQTCRNIFHNKDAFYVVNNDIEIHIWSPLVWWIIRRLYNFSRRVPIAVLNTETIFEWYHLNGIGRLLIYNWWNKSNTPYTCLYVCDDICVMTFQILNTPLYIYNCQRDQFRVIWNRVRVSSFNHHTRIKEHIHVIISPCPVLLNLY